MLPNEEDATERIECFCSRRPLLAKAGRDRRTGIGFVWIMVRKNRLPVVNVLVTSGTAHIQCHECLRVHRVTITPRDRKPYQRQLLDDPKDFSALIR